MTSWSGAKEPSSTSLLVMSTPQLSLKDFRSESLVERILALVPRDNVALPLATVAPLRLIALHHNAKWTIATATVMEGMFVSELNIGAWPNSCSARSPRVIPQPTFPDQPLARSLIVSI
jgi:hypothetical protein